MASKISKLLKEAIDEYSKEIAQEENKNIEIALNNTMKRIEEEVDKYLEWMARAYYDGYEPVWYVRTGQFKDKTTRPVNPYTEITTLGSMSNLSFGVIFDATSMNHKSYTIKARWYDKKNKKWKDVKKSKEYTVTPGKNKGKKPSEERILQFYQEGIHPNAVLEGFENMAGAPTPEPLFTNNKEGYIPELIEDWVENGGLQEIFNEELRKLI